MTITSRDSEIAVLFQQINWGTFAQCSIAVKKHYCVPIACQRMLSNCGANTHRLIWSAYEMLTIKPTELWVTCTEMLSVRPHRYVKTFDALFRKYLYGFVRRCESSSNFFIRSLQRSDAFCKSSFVLHYLTRLYDNVDDQLQYRSSAALSWCLFSTSLPLRNNLNLLCAS